MLEVDVPFSSDTSQIHFLVLTDQILIVSRKLILLVVIQHDTVISQGVDKSCWIHVCLRFFGFDFVEQTGFHVPVKCNVKAASPQLYS